jgi:hypothetical protein
MTTTLNPSYELPLGEIPKDDYSASREAKPYLFDPLGPDTSAPPAPPAPPVSTAQIATDVAKPTGSVLSFVGNKPPSKDFRQSQATNITAPKVVADIHAKNVSELLDQDKMHKANVSVTGNQFNDALNKALELDAIPENPKEVEGLFGKKFTYPGMLGAGAERHADTMSEVRQANKVQRGLEGVKEFEGEGSLPGYKRVSRLIVGSNVNPPNLYTPSQIEAQNALLKAYNEHQQAIENHAQHQVNLEKANENLKKATLNQAEKSAIHGGFESPQAIKLFKNLASKAGGALSALDLYDAFDKLKKGDYTGLADLSMGVGGAMMAVPGLEPIGALTALPGAGYTGLQSAQELYNRFNPKPSK